MCSTSNTFCLLSQCIVKNRNMPLLKKITTYFKNLHDALVEVLNKVALLFYDCSENRVGNQ